MKKNLSIAKRNNRVKNGLAQITVEIDGCWGRRIYGTHYDALHGMVVIVGKVYKEVHRS